jgi:hypothetical protein
MNWRRIALAMMLVASPASAQGLHGERTADGTPTFIASEGSLPPQGCFSDDGDATGPDRLTGNRNFSNFIGFLSDPLQNIDPRAVTELYPMFGSSWVSSIGPIPSGSFQVYGVGLTAALSDRFAVGLNQGGYAVAHFNRAEADRLRQLRAALGLPAQDFGGTREGFLNLGGFFQYTLIQDVPAQFLLTGGLRWEAPCGAYEVFQGHGPAHLAPYLTAGKELGCFHVLATTGYLFPAGPGDDTSNVFYANVHFDRQCFGWLYPVAEFNFNYHTTSVDLNRLTNRGYIDLDNFEAAGNLLTLAVGANAVLVCDRLEFGAVYSFPLATEHDFHFNALTVKMVLRY